MWIYSGVNSRHINLHVRIQPLMASKKFLGSNCLAWRRSCRVGLKKLPRGRHRMLGTRWKKDNVLPPRALDAAACILKAKFPTVQTLRYGSFAFLDGLPYVPHLFMPSQAMPSKITVEAQMAKQPEGHAMVFETWHERIKVVLKFWSL